MAQGQLGYDDTPFLPDGKWRVHDSNRPQPRIVTPGTFSTPEQPGQPPSDAIVLFDGTSLDGWVSVKDDSPAEWKLENGYMEVAPGTGNIRTEKGYGDCQLHVEWAAPTVIKGEGQGRGNSGVFVMTHYEIQVLDCYDNPTYPDGTTGSLYGQCPPLVNACSKPGEWHVFDIVFEGPRFDGDKVVRPASATVFHNGVLLHNRKELIGPTSHKSVQPYPVHEPELPLMLQDHGDLVRFRNIWLRPLTEYDAG